MKKVLIFVVLSILLITSLYISNVLANDVNTDNNSLPKGYLPFQDSSDCPVQILAYRIDYMESGETTVSMLLKNTSDLRVVGLQGTFQLFDNDGNSLNSIEGDPIFVFKDRAPLPASQPTPGTSFLIEEGHRVKMIKPQITQVLFEDQSIWREF